MVLPFDFVGLTKLTGYSNFHNSFLYLFGYDFFYGVLLTSSFIIFFFSNYCLSLKLIILGCILRVFTDEGALFGYFDTVFYLPFLLLLSRFVGLKHD